MVFVLTCGLRVVEYDGKVHNSQIYRKSIRIQQPSMNLLSGNVGYVLEYFSTL